MHKKEGVAIECGNAIEQGGGCTGKGEPRGRLSRDVVRKAGKCVWGCHGLFENSSFEVRLCNVGGIFFRTFFWRYFFKKSTAGIRLALSFLPYLPFLFPSPFSVLHLSFLILRVRAFCRRA